MRFLVLISIFVLGACDQFQPIENRACAAFFKERFDTEVPVPLSSFQSLDEPIAEQELRERFYPGELSQLEKIHFATFEDKPLMVRTVFFNGDTGIGSGIYELQGFMCKFLIVDGELYQEGSLIEEAQQRASHISMSELVTALGDEQVSGSVNQLVRDRELAHECCLP